MAENTGTEKGAGAAVVPANGAVAAAKPATPAKGTMSVAKKGTALPECQLITRLEDRGADSLRKVILQLSGNDPLFVEKFAECCKMQVNRHWKRNEKKEWTNPFLLIPLNSQLEALYKCASRKILPDGYNANLVPYLGRDEKKVEVVIDYKGPSARVSSLTPTRRRSARTTRSSGTAARLRGGRSTSASRAAKSAATAAG